MQNEIFFISGSLVMSFIIVYISIPSIIKVSRMKKLYDEPDERSSHTTAIPTLGGVAIFAGVTISMLLFVSDTYVCNLRFFIAAMIILFFIGIKDDILIIAPFTKMSGQIIAAAVFAILGDFRITHLHGFFDIFEIPFSASILLTVFTIIVIINAFNFIDGIDGLSASIAIVASATFGVWFFLIGDFADATISAALIGALAGFLRYNLFSKENKIFMGDTGSLIIGLIVSYIAIRFNELNINLNSPYFVLPSPTVSFAVLIIPLFDLIRVIFIRFFKGIPITKPDKRHIHHLLLRLGLSHKQVTLILVCVNLFFIFFAFEAAKFISIRRLLLVILLMSMIIFYIPSFIYHKKNKRKK